MITTLFEMKQMNMLVASHSLVCEKMGCIRDIVYLSWTSKVYFILICEEEIV